MGGLQRGGVGRSEGADVIVGSRSFWLWHSLSGRRLTTDQCDESPTRWRAVRQWGPSAAKLRQARGRWSYTEHTHGGPVQEVSAAHLPSGLGT